MEKTKASVISISNNLVFTFYILATIFGTLIFAHNQLVVGTIVNAMLFFTALNIDKKYHLSIAIFPSIFALFQGLLFGSFTMYLFYLLPFIWVSNYLLMSISKISNKGVLGILLPSLAKSLFLFLIAYFLINFKIIPKTFLVSFGLFQFITALTGGILFKLINKAIHAK